MSSTLHPRTVHQQNPRWPTGVVWFRLPDGVAGGKPINRKLVVGVMNPGPALRVNGDFRLFEVSDPCGICDGLRLPRKRVKRWVDKCRQELLLKGCSVQFARWHPLADID
jgi:hypothetical protein